MCAVIDRAYRGIRSFLQKYEGMGKSVHIAADGMQKLDLTSLSQR